jgi:hypothetical protein
MSRIQGTCVAIKQCVFEGQEQEMMQKYIAREISILKYIPRCCLCVKSEGGGGKGPLQLVLAAVADGRPT